MEITAPKLYKGDIFVDDRGTVGFNNDVDLTNVKRFYTVSNHTPGFIRAWHAHILEGKYFVMTSGSAIIGAVKLKTKDETIILDYGEQYSQALSATLPSVFYIPPGFANGIKLMTTDSTLMVLSTASLAESKVDDIRFNFYAETFNPFEVSFR
jgi:dTDP-4-dehydrorhamnose 3,5-epimerase-like enzyme